MITVLPWFALLAFQGVPKHLKELPEWAQRSVMASEGHQPPPGAAVWRLLDDRHLSLDAEDNLFIRRRLVQVVLRQTGAAEGSLYGELSDNADEQMMEFKGWHKREGGFYEELSKRDLIRMGTNKVNQVSTSQSVHAAFRYVSAGSIIAFESVTRKKSFLGSHELFPVANPFPVLAWSVTLDPQSPRGSISTHLNLLNHKGWGLNPRISQRAIYLEHIPAIVDEPMTADHFGAYPLLLARMEPSDTPDQRYASWDRFAIWYHGVFNEVAYPEGLPNLQPPTQQILEDVAQQMMARIVYRQVYMNPTRGWVPLNGAEIWRRSYGDCKDMVSCAAHVYKDKGIRVYPTLASIGPGIHWQPHDPVNPFFNHLIVAIPLQESLGFDAEVEVNGQRFLLFDPTSRQTPFGKLHRGHLGGSVLICTGEGARWTEVPEKAVETGRVALDVTGKVDGDNHFTGTLRITEHGGEWGIRYLVSSYSLDQLSEFLHARLGLPANTWLAVTECTSANNATHVTATLRMHDFLLTDGQSVQISSAFLPTPVPVLNRNGLPRQNPFSLEGIPRFQLHMQVALEKPVMPSREEGVYEGKIAHYRFKASGGSHLKLDFSLSMPAKDYPKYRLNEGMNDLTAFAQQFNRDIWDLHQWRLSPQ